MKLLEYAKAGQTTFYHPVSVIPVSVTKNSVTQTIVSSGAGWVTIAAASAGDQIEITYTPISDDPLPISKGGTGANSSTSLYSNLDNSHALLLPKWRAAVAKVKANVANCRILCIGDSTTLGVWSAGGLTTGNMKPFAWPTQLSTLINNSGVNSHANSFFEGGNSSTGGPSNYVNDSRVSIGASWVNSAAEALGGRFLTSTSAANSIVFTPTTNCDTFNLFYPRSTTQSWGSINFKINAGAPTVYNQVSGSTPITFGVGTLTTSLGANNCTVTYDSGPLAVFGGIEAYDSSKKWVSVMNAGRSGATTNHINNPTVLSLITSVGAELNIISLGINDWCTSVTIPTFKTNMQAIITAAKAAGDVLIVSPFPSQVGASGAPSTSVQNTYNAALFELAVANNCAIVNIYGRWVDYTTSNGYALYGDGLHPNQTGYADTAQAIFNVIGRV